MQVVSATPAHCVSMVNADTVRMHQHAITVCHRTKDRLSALLKHCSLICRGNPCSLLDTTSMSCIAGFLHVAKTSAEPATTASRNSACGVKCPGMTASRAQPSKPCQLRREAALQMSRRVFPTTIAACMLPSAVSPWLFLKWQEQHPQHLFFASRLEEHALHYASRKAKHVCE